MVARRWQLAYIGESHRSIGLYQVLCNPHFTKVSQIESLLQYRFATSKLLKKSPFGSRVLQNRSFAQPFLVVCGCLLPVFQVDLSTGLAALTTCICVVNVRRLRKSMCGECSWKTPKNHTSLWK